MTGWQALAGNIDHIGGISNRSADLQTFDWSVILIFDVLFPFSDRFLRGDFLSHVACLSHVLYKDGILQHTPKLAEYYCDSLPIAEHSSFLNELLSDDMLGEYVGGSHELCRHVFNCYVS